MIMSTNKDAENTEFSQLLENTVISLNIDAAENPEYYSSKEGIKLENVICENMLINARDTSFDGTIKVMGGAIFPDIVANKYYGVEVKSTVKNHWSTTGNSILESSRVGSVERIYLMFGKLAAPVEFRCRPYEECLSDVVVTHYPRYHVDMNLNEGETIFDKIEVPYDTFRLEDRPVEKITRYYKSKLEPGQSLWWMGTQEEPEAVSFTTMLWNKLSDKEKKHYKETALALYPQIFGGNYNQLALYLVSFGVVPPSLRDIFSAGGRSDIKTCGSTYTNMPAVFRRIYEHRSGVRDRILMTPKDELLENWNVSELWDERLEQWIVLAGSNCMRETSKIKKILTKKDKFLKWAHGDESSWDNIWGSESFNALRSIILLEKF